MNKAISALASVLLLAVLLTQPATAALPEAAATVNGKAVPTAKLVKLLIASYGKNMLEQMIALELVKQVAAKRGLVVTEKDYENELERTAKQGGFSKEMGDLKKLMAQYSREKGYSWAEFELTIRRNAYLRKIVEPMFKLDEKLVRSEYSRLYNKKVEVRIIRTRDPLVALRARHRIRQGEAFEKVAKEVSTAPSAVRGGKIPAFARGSFTGAMKAFESAAFLLKKPGDVSAPVGAGGHYYMIQLVRHIAPKGKSFEEVRETLAGQLYPRVLMKTMLAYMKRLRTVAGKVTIHIPALADKK